MARPDPVIDLLCPAYSFFQCGPKGWHRIYSKKDTNINVIYIFTMSLQALKGRGNPPLRAKRGNLTRKKVEIAMSLRSSQ